MKCSTLKKILVNVIVTSSLTVVTAGATDAELAQELTNPIADLMTIGMSPIN